MFCSLDVFIDKRHIAPNRNLLNFASLNKVLSSEIFVSENRQLKAIHLILYFKPLSNKFQAIGNAIKAGDPRLAQIDVSIIPGFWPEKISR